ncbi:site-specific integrase [Amphritea sp.]|uniref:site-specific integrase n=1 Tax=Amphritea sp. TaxID=1872502 RepID=UPI0025C0D859|nr:site-specific integrase [Amphritea sp.]
MPTRIPHTYRTSSGTYYLRLLWPKALRERIPDLGRETRLSLHTKDRATARRKVYNSLNKINFLLEKYSVRLYDNYSDVGQGLALCVQNIAHSVLDKPSSLSNLHSCKDRDISLDKNGDLAMLKLLQHRHPDGGLTIFDGNRTDEVEALAMLLARRNFYEQKFAQEDLNQLLPQRSHTFSRETQSEVTLEGVEGSTHVDEDNADASEQLVNNSIDHGKAQHERSPMIVKELIDDYIQERKKEGRWDNPSTCTKYMSQLRVLAELFGESTPVTSLSTLSIVDVKKKLQEYPDRRFVGKRENIPISELLNDESLKRICLKTAKGYFEVLKSVFKHATSSGYIKHDVAASIDFNAPQKSRSLRGVVGGKQKKNKRKVFQDKDLIRLFSGYIYGGSYTGNKRKLLPAHFWVPLIALYTGARINEICQLMISDISSAPVEWQGKVTEIPRFIITDEHPDQVLKTENSERKLPIHTKLIEMGFMDFVCKRKEQSVDHRNERLFEGMHWEESSRWGRVIGRWFNGESARPGYITERLGAERDKKVFHSFRHTVTDMLRNAGVGKSLRTAILGHEGETVNDDYGEGYWLEVMKKAIDAIQYSPQLEAMLSEIRFGDFERFAASIKPRSNRRSGILFAQTQSGLKEGQ